MGRPSAFTQEIADEICERLSKGESLRSICATSRDDFMPGRSTVNRWLAENEAFRDQYARAREAQADHFVDEIIEIADQPNVVRGADGEVVESDPQRDRLRIDARKWVASKLAPKKYGDKLDVNHGGEVGVSVTYVASAAPPLSGEDYETEG
jgi:hypothetical protein